VVWRVTNEPFEIDWNASGDARVLQCVANLLRMWTGESPFLRNVGIDISAQDAPSAPRKAMIMAEVARNLADYAPEATAVEIFVENRACGLFIAVDVEVSEV
jgi:hypothetical protein